MIGLFFRSSKPAWLTHVLSLVLALACSAVLILMFRKGVPSRLEFALLLCILLLTPLLLRWQSGWIMLFVFFPFMNFLRRVYLIFDFGQAGGGFTSTDFFILLPDSIVALMGVGYMLTRRSRKVDPLPTDDRWLRVPISLMIGLCAIEMINPTMGCLPAGLNGFRAFALYMFLYFLTQQAVRQRAQLDAWLMALLLVGTATGLYGAYQYIFGFPWYDKQWADAFGASTQVIGDSMRAFSSFSFTSTFSHYMVLGVLAAWIAVGMRSIPMLARILAPFFLGSMALGLAVTFVRSAMAGLMAALVLGAVIAGRKEGRPKRLILALGAVICVLVAMPKGAGEADYGGSNTGQLVTGRVLSIADPSKVGSMQARYGAWQRIVTDSVKYPVGIGIGAGQVSRFNGNFYVEGMAYSESQYFSVLAEEGWPGFLLFIWITIYGFVFGIRAHDELQNDDLKRLCRLALMMQAALCIVGLAGGVTLETLPGAPFYWTALALPTILKRFDDPVSLLVPEAV